MARGERVLITGGAGFVGSHFADRLKATGHEIVLYDNLEPQVHGALPGGRPDYLDPDLELVVGDVRDTDRLAPLVRSADLIVHFAAMVGVGQSMYQIVRYTDVNAMGAASLLQCLVDDPGRVRKLLVASSMSIYGEGSYHCQSCGSVAPRLRPDAQLREHDWAPRCPHCGQPVEAEPTPETKPLYPTSIYAITKRDHEEMFLAYSLAYGIPSVALRFFNIYGSRQALSNPYTGVAAIFSSRLLNGNAPIIFEDGGQSRDFVHVSDIAQACHLALDNAAADNEVFNVGAGRPTTIGQVADVLAERLGWTGQPEVTGRFRAGDIRHCYADISKIRHTLGYEPKVQFEDGVAELVSWVATQEGVVDSVTEATNQLASRGLVR